jgi:GNAT superfamily N-acetyltransferase
MDHAITTINPAAAGDTGTVLALIGALLAELGEEGQEFAQIDRVKLERDMDQASLSGRFLALLARDESGTAMGVLTLSTSFAVYAGGEYGVIDEMYVAPEWRGRGVGRRLVQAAVKVAEERRWFRLDVTGPGGASGEDGGLVGAAGAPGAPPGATALPAVAPAPPGAAPAGGALRFYRRLGFEPTGQKLRLLI